MGARDVSHMWCGALPAAKALAMSLLEMWPSGPPRCAPSLAPHHLRTPGLCRPPQHGLHAHPNYPRALLQRPLGAWPQGQGLATATRSCPRGPHHPALAPSTPPTHPPTSLSSGAPPPGPRPRPPPLPPSLLQ